MQASVMVKKLISENADELMAGFMGSFVQSAVNKMRFDIQNSQY